MRFIIPILLFFSSSLVCAGSGDVNTTPSPFPFDAIKWTEHTPPLLSSGASGSWNEVKGDTGNSILQQLDTLYLYHSGQNAKFINQIGLSVSKAGLYGPWSTLPNPLLTPGISDSWDEVGVAHPSVIKWGYEFLMYYSGFDLSKRVSIGRAISLDGLHFHRLASRPVLQAGAAGEWDAAGVDHPSVLFDYKNKIFVMAYRGWAGGEGYTDTHSQIGLATSQDGINWVKNANNPILGFGPIDSWDEHGLLAPRLWATEGAYHINYSGKSNGITSKSASSIGHAISTDLVGWVRNNQNPLIYAGYTEWTELEWGTPVWSKDCWSLLTSAWAEQGKTILFEGICP